MRTVFLLLALAAADDAKDPDEKEAPKVARVADPTYVPQPGDRASLDTRQRDEDGEPYEVPAAVSIEDYRSYVKLSTEANGDALDKLEDDKKLIRFEPGTEVQVVAISPVVMVGNAQAGAGVLCAAVQVVGGPSRGKTLYTSPQYLVRYVAVSTPPPAKRKTARGSPKGKAATEKKEPTGTPDPAARAASTLRLAEGLEKAGKMKGAVDLYRQLLKQYPNSPQARTAAERLKAIGDR